MFSGFPEEKGGIKMSGAAEMVTKSPYKEIAVVVSAMGNTTNNLIQTINQIGNVSDEEYAEILSMGERTSARAFCSALTVSGAKTVLFDPANDDWPIITDSAFRDAKPNMQKTRALVEKFMTPLLGNAIPVVCGFLGKDENGRVTTLGRGGSDTTALLLAECLEADEIVLVQENSGVLSADPIIVLDAKQLNQLDIHEMFDLAHGGAKIVKPESLKYKLPNQKLRIVDFASGSLSVGGTEITGSFNLNSVEMTSQTGLIAVNVVCEVNAKNLSEVFSMLSQKPIYGVSMEKT